MSVLLAVALAAGSLDQRTLNGVGARPAAETRLPAKLVFTRIDGRRITLGAVAGGMPLVVAFADFTCRNVCAPALSLTAATLAQTGLAPGRDYRVAVIGLDPKDGTAAADMMAARIGVSPALVRATTVLLGDAKATPDLGHALGYSYAYDASTDQFAHDASLYIFADDGRLVAVLPELGLRSDVLRAAIARAVPPATLADQVAHLCYGFAAAHGRYGGAIVLGLQALSAVLLAGSAWWFWRRLRPE